MEEEIKNHSLNIRLKELQNIIYSYERKFNKLPCRSIKLAGYERKKESLEQLYSLVEKKYQEAAIKRAFPAR